MGWGIPLQWWWCHKWSPEQCCCQSLGPPRARQDHRERPIGRAGQEYWSLASSNWDGKGFVKNTFPFILHFHLIFTDIWAIGNIYKKILHTEGKVSECCNTSIEEVNMMLITRGKHKIIYGLLNKMNFTPIQWNRTTVEPYPLPSKHNQPDDWERGGFSKIPFYLAARDNMAEVGDVVEE